MYKSMLKFGVIIGFSVCLVASIPSPIEIEDDYEEGEDVCLTSKDSKDAEKECVFPFRHDNYTYYGCPLDNENRRWCSTKTDKDGVHIPGEGVWGYCTTGCNPEIIVDELSIGAKADKNTQADTCDFTACNGYTLKTNIFDENEVTFGQCQFAAGENGSKDDYFCFVNPNSACKDKVPFDEEEGGLSISKLACKDPKAPKPRFFGHFGFSFPWGFSRSSIGFVGSRNFRSNVDVYETKKKVEIEIQFRGHKFQEEDLDIEVTKRNTLIVKVADDKEEFIDTFKLSKNTLFDEIETKFDVKRDRLQTIVINIPKNETIAEKDPIDDEDYSYYYVY